MSRKGRQSMLCALPKPMMNSAGYMEMHTEGAGTQTDARCVACAFECSSPIARRASGERHSTSGWNRLISGASRQSPAALCTAQSTPAICGDSLSGHDCTARHAPLSCTAHAGTLTCSDSQLDFLAPSGSPLRSPGRACCTLLTLTADSTEDCWHDRQWSLWSCYSHASRPKMAAAVSNACSNISKRSPNPVLCQHMACIVHRPSPTAQP